MKNILGTFTFVCVSALVLLSSCASTAVTREKAEENAEENAATGENAEENALAGENAATIRSQLDELSIRTAELQDALNQAKALLERLLESDKGSTDETRSTKTPSGSDLARSAIDVDSVYNPLATGRGSGEAVSGSNLIIQSDGGSGNYLSHRNYGPGSDEKAYLEIQQSPGTGLELFLVLQQVTDARSESTGLYGGDLSLAETFPVPLPEYAHREILEDPSRRLERIYIPVDRSILQTLGRMANEHRGEIILKGLYGEERMLLNEENGRALKEVLSAFIELSSTATL